MKLATLEFAGRKFQRGYITTANDMAKAFGFLLKSPAKRFGLDIETMKTHPHVPVKKGNRTIGPAPGLCPHLSAIRLIQIYDPESSVCFVFDLLKIKQDGVNWRSSSLLQIFFREKVFIAHNGLFEIKHLLAAGFKDLKVDCSMLLSILVDRAEHSPFEADEAREDDDEDPIPRKGFGLDAVCGRMFNVRVAKHEQTSNWNAPELTKSQINYAALDALLTYLVGVKMTKAVKKYGMEEAYKVLRDMQHVVADMELTGLAIDWTAHKLLMTEWVKANEAALKQVHRRFGPDINPRSHKQLGEWAAKKYPEKFLKQLWPKTKKNKISFGKNALKEVIDILERRFEKKASALEALLTYKKHDKLLSTYGETLVAIQHPITGRLHSSFIIGETRTGRLSCREPNLQNLPREDSVRKLFTAPRGKILLVADYSQIEMRAEGALSGDVVMQQAFERDVDLHERIVKICFGWDLSKEKDKAVRKNKRQSGKAINFGFSFGMGGPKFERYALTDYGVKIPLGDGKRIQQIYQKTYPGYYRWCLEQRRKCEKLGFVRTPMGRMRKLEPDEQYTKAVNTPVQGGAAEAIMIALIKLRKELPFGCRIVSTVHDEIIVECPDANPKVKTILEECMTFGFKKVFPNGVSRKLVDAHFGNSWATAKA